ncbi:MAG: hypothetical protein GF330_02040 [Candidatus Eisenbacteria bacterium]|nr:hypothetical protein [Candidatus Eisenbacteria bacterium]
MGHTRPALRGSHGAREIRLESVRPACQNALRTCGTPLVGPCGALCAAPPLAIFEEGGPIMRGDLLRSLLTFGGLLPTLSLGLAGIALAPCEAAEPTFPDEAGLILRDLPLPTTTPGDLAWDGEHVWIADWQAGQLLWIDPADGTLLGRMPAPCYRPRGLTWGDDRLYVADDFEGRLYVFDPEQRRTETTYLLPSETALGLAWDGERLWVADNGEQALQALIPRDGTVLTYFDAPAREPGGMACDDRYLWVSVRQRDRVYMVGRQAQKVITSFDTPGPYPCGLAPAGEGRLWLADFETGRLYLCAPREADAIQTSDWREAEVRMTARIENLGPGLVRDAFVHFAVAEPALPHQTLLEELRFFGPGEAMRWSDAWDQQIASFRVPEVPAGGRFEVGYDARVRIADRNTILIPEKVGPREAIPPEIRARYTVDGERLQVSSRLVQETAQRIVGAETHPYWMMRRIYDWVIETLEYERVGGWDVPETLIRRGTGSCSEYTFLFIALCRAVGIPARYEAGTALRGDDASVDDVYHRWAEVYLPGYGWVPVDPSRGDQSSPGAQADAIGRLTNRIFITTHGGGGSEALSWTYNARSGYGLEGRCRVNEDQWVVWRRAKEEGQAVIPSGAEVAP